MPYFLKNDPSLLKVNLLTVKGVLIFKKLYYIYFFIFFFGKHTKMY